jgi:6-phosphogluconolactonase
VSDPSCHTCIGGWKRTKLRFGLSLVIASGCALLPAGAASAASDVVGQVYVNDNTREVNTVGAFDRHADGTLTPMRGSPFAASGVGTGQALTSQGSLQLSSDGRYLLGVDAGSSQISVLRIKTGGSLKRVGRSPVSSNGTNPVSIAVYGHLVYVAQAGTPGSADGTNYTGFAVDPDGHLRPLVGSTVTLPDTSQPGDVLFSPDGRKLVGTRVATSLIDSFTVGRGGLLTAAPGSPFAAQGMGPFGSEFRPTNAEQLYVTNANDGANTGTVSAFAVGAEGALTTIAASPFPDDQTAPCWVEMSHDGQYLFAVNTASGSLSSDTSQRLRAVRCTPYARRNAHHRITPCGNRRRRLASRRVAPTVRSSRPACRAMSWSRSQSRCPTEHAPLVQISAAPPASPWLTLTRPGPGPPALGEPAPETGRRSHVRTADRHERRPASNSPRPHGPSSAAGPVRPSAARTWRGPPRRERRDLVLWVCPGGGHGRHGHAAQSSRDASLSQRA